MKHRLRSDEPFELDTFWWPPGSDGQLPAEGTSADSHGTLRYSPQDGFELTVFDLLPANEPARIPALFGESLEHKPCALLEVTLLNSTGNLFGGHRRFVLHAHQFLLGEHFAEFEQVKSKRFHVRLGGLREWLTIPFRVDPGQVRHGLSRQGNPEGLSVQLQGARLLLGFDWRERGGQVIQEDATATFVFDNELRFQQFLADWLVPLQHFLVLATREQSLLQSLVLERYDERRAESLHPAIRVAGRPETWNSWRVEVARTPNVPLARPRQSTFKRILLPAAALADDLEGVLRRWWELAWRLREPGAYFFTSLNQDLPPLDRHLLDCMSFAETYHRVNSDHWAIPPTPPMPKDQHKRLRDSMLEGLGHHPARERYKRALDYANRPDNAERITALFVRAREADCAVELQEDTLPGELVATRNYLTHWNDKTKKVLDGAARFHALRRLILVLQVNLLLDLGLSTGAVKACVDDSYRTAVWTDE